jgi:hypothetical protein
MDFLNNRHPTLARLFGLVSALLILSMGGIPSALGASDPYAAWDETLTPAPSKLSMPIAPFVAEYRFGWEGIEAGGAKVQVTALTTSRCRIVARGGPNEFIRKLWNYEAVYIGETGRDGEVPSWFSLDESYPTGAMRSDAIFKEAKVVAVHRKMSEVKPWESTDLPEVRDLFSTMLFVRSQPLRNGDKLRLVVFPDQNPYLADLTVAGRDTLTVMGKKIRAIRFTLKIQTIETHGSNKGRLEPYRKFHSAHIWISDDAERLPLRAEVDLFIGRIFAELNSLKKQL